MTGGADMGKVRGRGRGNECRFLITTLLFSYMRLYVCMHIETNTHVHTYTCMYIYAVVLFVVLAAIYVCMTSSILVILTKAGKSISMCLKFLIPIEIMLPILDH